MKSKYTRIFLPASAVILLSGCSAERLETAVMNTFMGIGTVFIILALISVLIYCFKVIPYLSEKLRRKPEPGPTREEIMDKRLLTPEPKVPPKQEDDEELVAVIAAAVAAQTGMDPNVFIVRRIRRIK